MDNAMRAILEAAREYGFFVDRGDLAAYDMDTGDFIKDNAWHMVDFSAIVPEHAHAILLHAKLRATAIDRTLGVRRDGYVNFTNICELTTLVANIRVYADFVCTCGPDRKLSYRVADVTVNLCRLSIKGWWF